MSENFPDFFAILTQKLGLKLPGNVSQGTPIQSEGSLQDFIKAPRAPLLNRVLLLDLVQPRLCHKDAGSEVKEIVGPYTFGKPGFSNVLPDTYATRVAKASMVEREVVATMIKSKKAQDEDDMRHIINENIVPDVLADCEDQLINGHKNGIEGLLQDSDFSFIEREENQSRLDFYFLALKKYASDAGRAPTHIALPFREILQLLEEQQNNVGACLGQTGFPNKLLGIPVIISNALPENRGLILATNDIVLLSSPRLKWIFGYEEYKINIRNQAKVAVKYKMGVLIKQLKTTMRLGLERNKG